MAQSSGYESDIQGKLRLDAPIEITELDLFTFSTEIGDRMSLVEPSGIDLDLSGLDSSEYSGNIIKNLGFNNLENIWMESFDQPQTNMRDCSSSSEVETLENYMFSDMNGSIDSRKTVLNNDENILKSVDKFNTLMESAWNYNAMGKLSVAELESLESLESYSELTPIESDREVAKSNVANMNFGENSQHLYYTITPTPSFQHQGDEIPRVTNDIDNLQVTNVVKPYNSRKVKRSPQRFKKEVDSKHFCLTDSPSNPNIDLEISCSSVTCLSVTIDYKKYTGVITDVSYNHPDLINNYCKPHDQVAAASRAVELYPDAEEINSTVSAIRQRVKYTRRLDEVLDMVKNIVYKSSSVFALDNPYEPQYYRFELDHDGNLVNESKCGLCPYCMELRFLPFKNSSYLSHLTLEHGIYSNNFLTPNGLYYGRYKVMKKEKMSGSNKRHIKSRDVDAIQCPHCFEIIEIGCWSMKSNKLLSYFRHFKNKHGDEVQSKEVAVQKPSIQARGRTLKVIE